jgi:hypothetical protein
VGPALRLLVVEKEVVLDNTLSAICANHFNVNVKTFLFLAGEILRRGIYIDNMDSDC